MIDDSRTTTEENNLDIESPMEQQRVNYLNHYLKRNESRSNTHHSIRMMRLEMPEFDEDHMEAHLNPIDSGRQFDKNISDFEHEDDDDRDETVANDDDITKLDTKRLIRLRVLLMFTLVLSATIVSFVVHDYIATNETKQFKDRFCNDANKLLEAVSSSLERTLGAMNALSIAFVSYASSDAAKDSNSNSFATKWPFVTLPDFALHASKLLPLTDGVYVSIQPIVYPSQKRDWEEFASQNDQWVNETLNIQEVWNGYHGGETYTWMKNKHIYGTFGDIESNVSRYMLPQWQGFPIALEDGIYPYNFDWNALLQTESIQSCIEKQHVILSEPYMIPFPDDEQANAEMADWSNFFSNFLPPEDEPFEPMLDVYYPIVNDLSRHAVFETDKTNASSVGMLVIPIYWRSFIRNILTEGSNGIVVVIHNTCNQPFTYQINGNQVVYLGVGDKHDVKYDDLVVISKVADLKSFALKDSGYSGAAIDVDYCPYTLNIYPSDTMKSTYVSNDATIFAVSVFLIFCFTSFIFILYDRYVERRQQKVKSAAMHSLTIISSLFPMSVRERLFPRTPNEMPQQSQTTSKISVNKSTASAIIGSPIAQEYPDTTVIFADIVGFTAWSSSRDPIQVFHLLETLYAGFDELANMYGVFKIETIGDCYVAVVGLPKRRKNHAVVMVKFASAICAKMMELINEMEVTLGPGTSNLALRVGLNSGPTTAGVLRGEKARFQLFGDTVNTAARMETSGAPFKIHVSGSTAELIRAAGKGHWLDARKEQIVAKGKGVMQTYWCEPSAIPTFIDDSSANDLDSYQVDEGR